MYCNSTEKYGTATMMVSSYIEQKSEQPDGGKQIVATNFDHLTRLNH